MNFIETLVEDNAAFYYNLMDLNFQQTRVRR